MKLYATVTSERASKGQGGGYLDILIQDENKNPMATIQVKCLENNYQFHLEMLAKGYEKTGAGYFHSLIGKQKGEKKKGEVCYCEESGLSSPHLNSDH